MCYFGYTFIAGPSLIHHVMSLSSASSPDDDIISKNVLGYITMYVRIQIAPKL